MASPPEVLETTLVDVFWSERGVTLRLAGGPDVDLPDAHATALARAILAGVPDPVRALHAPPRPAPTFQDCQRALRDLVEAFVATGYGRAAWTTTPQGWTLHLSTGGWSECEAAWAAFESAPANTPAGLARDLWWTAWQAGGHYTFTGRPAHDPRAVAPGAESPCATGPGGA